MRRILALTAVTAAATVGLGVTSAQAATPHQAVSAPRCDTSGLRVTVQNAPGQAGMSHDGVFLRFTNTSGHTCLLRGYPGLGLQDSAHKTLKSDVTWGSTYFDPTPGVRTLTLKPGADAWADLSWATAYPQITHSSYLVVTPPNARTYKTVAFKEPVGAGRLSVTALSLTKPSS